MEAPPASAAGRRIAQICDWQRGSPDVAPRVVGATLTPSQTFESQSLLPYRFGLPQNVGALPGRPWTMIDLLKYFACWRHYIHEGILSNESAGVDMAGDVVPALNMPCAKTAKEEKKCALQKRLSCWLA
jgi:hypothetical protein